MSEDGYAARTKYDEPGRAERYARRSARRHDEEWLLLSRVLDDVGVARGATALDAPCGTGRIAAALLERGLLVRGADLSPAMRAEAERRLAGRAGLLGIDPLDLDAAPAGDVERFDLVVCFRFLHHLPDEERRVAVLRSLAARVKRPQGHVVLSFHHPVSGHALARAARRLWTGRRGDRHTMTVGRLRREAERAGLAVVRVAALSPYLREFWVAALRPAQT